ncbi:MAG: septum formation inhibitor [Bacteroidales bacterium]|nr:septum formation inhibitor [Bacteroidales bacterium]
MFRKFSPRLKNKYVIAILVFLIWMMFFDRNNFIHQIRLVSTLNGLDDQRVYYLEEIKKDSAELSTLLNDTSQLERFAREKYLMKKDNEDIFIVLDKDK